jgi:hypothetical protein
MEQQRCLMTLLYTNRTEDLTNKLEDLQNTLPQILTLELRQQIQHCAKELIEQASTEKNNAASLLELKAEGIQSRGLGACREGDTADNSKTRRRQTPFQITRRDTSFGTMLCVCRQYECDDPTFPFIERHISILLNPASWLVRLGLTYALQVRSAYRATTGWKMSLQTYNVISSVVRNKFYLLTGIATPRQCGNFPIR